MIERLSALEDARKDGAIELPNGDVAHVTNLAKVFWPALGITKGELLRYYVAVSPLILPVVDDRPLVMKRFPNGVTKQAFYQQRHPEAVPPGVRREVLPDDVEPISEEGPRDRLIGGSLTTLLYMTQLAAVSQDPWFSRVADPTHQDYAAIDLDPGDGVTFARLLDVARWVKDELDRFDIPAWPKTSGSRGLHIYIPLPAKTTYETGQLLCQMIATVVSTAHPRAATVERMVKKRPAGTVYIDYLQNILGKTLACAYSARASDYAGVSTPLSWAEVQARSRSTRLHDAHGAGPVRKGRRSLGPDAQRAAGKSESRAAQARPGHLTAAAGGARQTSYDVGRVCRPRLRRPLRPPSAERPDRRSGRQSGVHQRALRTCDRPRRTERRRRGRHLRPAARVPVGSAGKHDRIGPRAGRPAPRPDLLALQRNAGADGGDAGGSRRARDRSAGRRDAHLHLHLHDGQLPARRAPAWPAGGRLRPAESDRRRRGRGPDARRGIRVVRRTVRHSDAARHDNRGAGADCSTTISRSAPSSKSSTCMAGPAITSSTRPDCRGCLPSPNLPTLESAIVYPGTVLFEGTNVSEGRGTTRAVRTGGRAVGRSGAVCERLERQRSGRRALPAGHVRADVSQARARPLRRLPDPHHRSA